jgi:glycosyltransferase involved in cell wall biosynthesis
MKRVAHLITRLDLGGAQVNTLASCAGHDRSRYAVALLAGEGGHLDGEARSLDDVFVAITPELEHRIRPLKDARATLRLARWLKHNRVDVLHTHSSKAGVLGRLAARMAGVPVVVHTVHGWSFNDTQRAPVRAAYVALERLCARWTDKLVVVASTDADLGVSEGVGERDDYVTIRSAVPLEKFRSPGMSRAEARASLGYDDEVVVVGAIANLKPQKDPLTFVECARIVCEAEPRARFFLAGDGHLREETEAAIAAAGLEEKVRLLGWVDDAERLYRAMDVFLLSSRFEGLPRSVVQAQAAGVVVVATAVNGTREVVLEGETGRLAEPGDAAGLARAVIELAGDPDERARLAAEARARQGDEFEQDEMIRALDALYSELLASSSS